MTLPHSPRIQHGAANFFRWLAAPVFLVMAIVNAHFENGMLALCSGSGHHGYLTGMATMYAFMSFVHSKPWFEWLAAHFNEALLSNAADKR